MKISVIIPSYNRAHTLGRALDSVVVQKDVMVEIIVVDDASDDETVDLLSGYPSIKHIRFTNNAGVSRARNAGIEAAKYDWLAFLDSDDTWMPNKLSKQIHAVYDTPGAQFIHTDERWIRNGKRVNPMKKHAKPDGWVYQASLALCCVSPSSVLVHRSVLSDCGNFDESLPACEDYDLWLRIFSRYPVKLVDESLVVKYGGHADQLSRKYWGMDRFRIKALGKMLDLNVLNAEDQASTLDMLQTKCDIMCKGALKRNKLEEAEYYQQLAAKYACKENQS